MRGRPFKTKTVLLYCPYQCGDDCGVSGSLLCERRSHRGHMRSSSGHCEFSCEFSRCWSVGRKNMLRKDKTLHIIWINTQPMMSGTLGGKYKFISRYKRHTQIKCDTHCFKCLVTKLANVASILVDFVNMPVTDSTLRYGSFSSPIWLIGDFKWNDFLPATSTQRSTTLVCVKNKQHYISSLLQIPFTGWNYVG